MAGFIVVNKIGTAAREDVEAVIGLIKEVNPGATIIMAESPVAVEQPDLIRGKRVLVIEDGPTLTHGDMGYGAGIVAAEKYGVAECIDPRPFAVGDIKATLEKFTQIGKLVPAMGYGDKQVSDLEATIKASGADAVVNGSPADIEKLISVDIPIVRVSYELKEIGTPSIETIVRELLEKRG
jgi:predicted GTPase